MKFIGTLFIMASAAVTALSQTNSVEIRKLSLEDCIQIALEHNLDVQIKRFNPEVGRFTLSADYGAYDPNFSATGGHDFNQQPGGIDPQGRPFGGTETDVNRLNTGIQGLLPWGLNYTLAGGLSDTYGTRPTLAQGTTITGYTTNTVIIAGVPIAVAQPNYDVVTVRTPFENVVGTVGFLQLRQPLLKNFWTDSTRLQIFLDKKNLKISELDVRQQVIQTVTDVETAYYNLIFSQKNVKVQEKALELADRLVVENKKRVEVGALAPLDEKQAEAQAAASRADLLAAQGSEDTQERVLKSLLSDDYSKWKNAALQPTAALIALPERFNLQQSWERGLRLRPDLLQAQLNVEKQGYVVKYRKNQLLPQMDLVGDYGLNASSTTVSDALGQFAGQDNPFWTVGGQLTIPLGNVSARNSYRAAKATKDQVQLQMKQVEQNILILIENAIANAKTSFQRVDATREARIYAEAALDAEQKKLESGKSTSFEVLRLQRDLTTAASTEIRALADYNIALAQIALQEGTTLERRHVNLQVK